MGKASKFQEKVGRKQSGVILKKKEDRLRREMVLVKRGKRADEWGWKTKLLQLNKKKEP